VAQVDPGWESDGIEVVLAASDYTYIRVFKTDGTYLIGPEQGHNQEHVLQPADFTNGLITLWVEGLDLGAGVTTRQVTFSLIYRQAHQAGDIFLDLPPGRWRHGAGS